jgi:2-dehydro-3-deoxyphosphogluconate aldolase/(4S)-4-hydroxy-2-oxoglutarate aldolase
MSERRRETVAALGRLRASAIIRATDEETARQAMRAAVRGGFRSVEFTLTTPGALCLIEEFSSEAGLLVGAGTVLTPGSAREAAKAGARFLVSPVMDPGVIRAARDLDCAAVPGTATPTEMWAAERAGADIFKVFPGAADVPAFVRQILGPLPHFKLLPTAGVTPDNFTAVLEAGAFGVGFVGSLFLPRDLQAGAWDAVESRARTIQRALSTAR